MQADNGQVDSFRRNNVSQISTKTNSVPAWKNKISEELLEPPKKSTKNYKKMQFYAPSDVIFFAFSFQPREQNNQVT